MKQRNSDIALRKRLSAFISTIPTLALCLSGFSLTGCSSVWYSLKVHDEQLAENHKNLIGKDISKNPSDSPQNKSKNFSDSPQNEENPLSELEEPRISRQDSPRELSEELNRLPKLGEPKSSGRDTPQISSRSEPRSRSYERPRIDVPPPRPL